MSDLLLTTLTWTLFTLGSFFLIVGSFGLLRMKDFFSRVHATSVIDSLGVLLILVGLMLYIGWEQTTFKVALLIILLLITGPTTVYAMCKAVRHHDDKHNEQQQAEDGNTV